MSEHFLEILLKLIYQYNQFKKLVISISQFQVFLIDWKNLTVEVFLNYKW